MFTGLIENKALVFNNSESGAGRRLVLHSPFSEIPRAGESIAVNGACLTCLPIDKEGHLAFDVSPETLALTNLGTLQQGSSVNLERALKVHARLGGHYVSGHIDTTARLSCITPMGEYLEIEVNDFANSIDASPYLFPKGSISLDGVSLTINRVAQGSIILMLVPHTLDKTILGDIAVGHRFNVEFDYLARIVAHQLTIFAKPNNEVYS